MPNLPPSGVIIMDTASYRSNKYGKAPLWSSNKWAMIGWLKLNGFSAEVSMRKTVLFGHSELKKPRGKSTKIDQLFSAHSYTVIR
jgi:hypothetical protein